MLGLHENGKEEPQENLIPAVIIENKCDQPVLSVPERCQQDALISGTLMSCYRSK